MEELARRIEDLADEARNPDFDKARDELRSAAKTLAAFAIGELADEPRYLALRVCDDLAAFVNWLDENPKS